MEFRIAVPTYRRAKTIRRHTLGMLEKLGVPSSIVDIFLSDASELDEYRAVLGTEYNLVIGALGIHRQREFIHNYYPEGERVLCIDDDVRALKTLYKDVEFVTLVQSCFEVAEREGCRLWGVYPSDVTMQLKDRAVKGLVYCIGSFYGMTNWHGTVYPHQTTEDFVRTIRAYQMDGAVIRFEGLAPTTRYFKEPGGLSDHRRLGVQEAEMRALAEEFPELVVLRKKHVEVDARFVRRVGNIIVEPFKDVGV